MAAEILPSPDGLSIHSPRPSRKSSPTSSSIFLGGSPPSLSSSPKAVSSPPSAEYHEVISKPDTSFYNRTDSVADSASIHSYTSTPRSSGLSLQTDLTADDDIDFPNYEMQFSDPPGHSNESSKSADDDTEVPEISTTTDTTRSDSPIHTPTVVDDTAIREEPSQHVDYLSHNWREEDIWASWRHIVSQRKVYGQKSRLENASWRTWAKSKYRLRTISPETLNWLKESDVTWLYGPLKPAQTRPITSDADNSSSQMSKNSSFINKKPILKKRSVSEVMLQKSLSTSSLVKQAASSVQEQQRKPARRGLHRTASDFGSSPWTAPSVPPSRDDYFSSRPSSVEASTPSEGREERHIRFDEKVEQCIAVECKEPTFDDDSEPEMEDETPDNALSESSSDEGLVMMKRKRKGNRSGSDGKGRLSRTNSMNNSMIETIPSTTLKNRTDSPDVTAEAQHHVFGKNWSSGTLNPSPSQETLRPARPSRNFLLADDSDADEDGDDGSSSSWSFGASNPKSSLGASAGPSIEERDFGYEGIEGMRRTESGMFMPYDEDEDDLVAAGLFGRVSETINTVRDIGYVLWNVGFRNGTGSDSGAGR